MFELPKLPYSFRDLEPHIDAKTMEIHYTKHHQAYLDKLNETLAGSGEENKSIEELIKEVADLPDALQTVVRNHGGGHLNHTLFWQSMHLVENSEPEGELLEAINQSFGSLETMMEQFTDVATKRFGSGWAWLVKKEDGSLAVSSTANQDNPLMVGVAELVGRPLLGLDVWEHAYYLLYQNRRADYIKAWWNVVNWSVVAERLMNK